MDGSCTMTTIRDYLIVTAALVWLLFFDGIRTVATITYNLLGG